MSIPDSKVRSPFRTLGVPEYNTPFLSVRFCECIHQCISEVAPLVVRSNVSKVDEGIHSEGYTETACIK